MLQVNIHGGRLWPTFPRLFVAQHPIIHQVWAPDILHSWAWKQLISRGEKWAEVLLAVFGTLVGTIGKQMIRRSEMYKQDHFHGKQLVRYGKQIPKSVIPKR